MQTQLAAAIAAAIALDADATEAAIQLAIDAVVLPAETDAADVAAAAEELATARQDALTIFLNNLYN